MRQKSSGQNRRPLSDLSNTTLLPISSSSFKPSSRLVAPISSSDTSVGSSNSHQPNRKSQTNPEPDSSRLSENIDRENYGHSKIDSQSCVEGEKNKGNTVAVVVPSICPPASRRKAPGDRLKNLDNVDPSKKHLVPECKRMKKRRYSMPEAPVHALPQDFIDKQRAYFAEIDAFQLTEEVVSESELE